MAGPHPAVAAGRRAIRDLGIAPGARVLLAVSGGQDSLALAICTAFVAERDGLKARAVIIDHQLRPESASEATHAAALLDQIGLAAEIIAVEVPGGSAGRGHGGPEAAARGARRQALIAVAERFGASAILLGHTLDDQAETVLLSLARGSGAGALSGMAPRDGLWLRPFLGLRRSDTAAICAAAGLAPVLDPSNELDGPWRQQDGSPLRRIRVRHEVMPLLAEVLGDQVSVSLARTAQLARSDDDALSERATAAFERANVPNAPADQVWLTLAELVGLHSAIRSRIIHRALTRVMPAGEQVGQVHVQEVDRLVTLRAVHGPIYVPGGVIATKESGMLKVATPQGELRGRC
ncbi:tRNA lysidine(34) synthetase TilS [Bowdeniella nasicola]|uniref:tRNA(Ile)-lysidine synthase n=1 Tax=Bowdeniella nasicola TaxID=208480 RepID=A0A1Q5Q3G9_9ACTO|nr:tRNA lysidine(34) synthetase TilS [Bowdeniella nasicola]OKL54180.1 tRNA lysidine(34) synthetase TilS [Bowdeniella nasicola]